MALSDLGPADRHRRIAGAFTDRVRAAKNWDADAPVAGWKARDVVRHLVEWLPALLAGGSDVRLPAAGDVDADPAAAWQAHCDAVQAVLDDPATPGRTLSNPHIGELPLDQAIDRFYTTDVFLHTWDLARATGQDDRLDPEFCAMLLGGMEPLDEMLRASGQYGPRVPVPADADAQTRLIGFIGRDPFWTPA
ncbi:TIGR03086 family metal-binding protein [Couchioplanes caeruleus]|uniref:TIGR03086 family metal-binding protein n=1 Tax=Couchioplanes caeruleus TaxID=56438 RepID=UPI0020C00B0B|nr:TIGR03086 family metal-binding protein [Couchioplanes caeruleus]UQU61317.1 TIGR03086 family metal-binding protein [Couchioplanes caeruleus]